MNDKILIFGGTTEGRILAEILQNAGIPHAVSVATEYGEEIEEKNGEDNLFVGRKSADEMADIMKSGDYSIVVDATHPFATGVSSEIVNACKMAEAFYVRLSRKTDTAQEKCCHIIYADSVEEAAAKMTEFGKTALVLTGSKDLKIITEVVKGRMDLYVRVLPNEESILKCKEAGISGKQIIAMQGPFSKLINTALIKEVNADVILTKESGKEGGFDEKMEAAKECGIMAVVIRNPEKAEGSHKGESLKGVLSMISEKTGVLLTYDENACNGKISGRTRGSGMLQKHIVLAGMGPGDKKYFTSDFLDAINNADVVFAAGSVLNKLRESTGFTGTMEAMYIGSDIAEYLLKHPEYVNPVAIFSGDISVCSGAIKACDIFKKEGYTVEKISGISSVQLFASRLGLDLEKCKVISVHGKECNVIGYALEEENLIVLTAGCEQAIKICEKLPKGIKSVIGYELGTSGEKIIHVKKDDALGLSFENPEGEIDSTFDKTEVKGRCLLYIKNCDAMKRTVISSIKEDEYIRGNVPMTKDEVRGVSLRKLELSANAVLYDVGAGTGSVSVEAALLHPGIRVYSIEKKHEAVELLLQNKEKFHVDNMTIIEGYAPEVLLDLPAPTHAFIGGSSGNLKDVIRVLKEKNSFIRIVINCVTPETIAEVMAICKAEPNYETQIVQVSATRFKDVGKYHMPEAGNPVYVVTHFRR